SSGGGGGGGGDEERRWFSGAAGRSGCRSRARAGRGSRGRGGYRGGSRGGRGCSGGARACAGHARASHARGVGAGGGDMHGLRHTRLAGSSRRSRSNGANSQSLGANDVDSQLNHGGDDDNNDGAMIATAKAVEEPPKRGRGKRNRTQLKVPPRDGKIQLKPKGNKQFTYVNYNPKGSCKYGSQVGVILKRLYLGIVDVRDEDGRIIETRVATRWTDYFWKKDECGVTHAKRVKQEFWRLFSVHRNDMRKASRNLETYLVKRVSDVMYQARLDAVKLHENCTDDVAKTIELTEEQYLECKLDWCTTEAWSLLAKHWTSKEYKVKRVAAQASRLKSDDVAQNRGSSRPWGETQQFLVHKFGSGKAGTLNTYAVMKSGVKNVDSSGKSAPIRSQKAQKRLVCHSPYAFYQTELDEYNARAKPSENSKDLDGGLRHGRVPIGDGAVDMEEVLAPAKSKNLRNTTNGQLVTENVTLKQSNEILVEENGVHREMMLRMYADFNKEPPTDLLSRLLNLDARRH
ncbi:hypothetical protein PVAP13_6KG237000, partial [Panicum virgatum]